MADYMEEWSLVDLALCDTPKGWENFFSRAKVLEELRTNDKLLAEKEAIYGKYLPLRKNVFAAFHAIDPKDVKVIIFGQDPYPSYLYDGTPRATGMSFSIRHDDSVTVSLKTMFSMAYNSFPDGMSQFPVPEGEEPCPLRPYQHGDLSSWCSQGVMLLNSALTICPDENQTHYDMWASFLKSTVEYILEFNPKLITVLFGREAQKMLRILQRTNIFTLPHPAARDTKNKNEFINSKLFAKINIKLIENGQVPIDWNLPTIQEVESYYESIAPPPLEGDP